MGGVPLFFFATKNYTRRCLITNMRVSTSGAEDVCDRLGMSWRGKFFRPPKLVVVDYDLELEEVLM